MMINFYYDPDINKLHIEWSFCRKTYRKARFIKRAMREFNHIFITAHEINAKSGALIINNP